MDRRRANNRAESGKGFEQLKPFRSEASDRGALIWFLAALGITLIVSLPCCAPQPAHAAPSTINGTCYVECTNPEIDGPMGGNTFIVRFPQYGIEATGHCTSGPMYGTPLPGHYPFTGTRLGNGGYAIAIDCSGAGMYPNHYSPLGAQNVGEFTIYLHGSVELQKHGNPTYENAVPEASVEGARYQLVAADGSACASLTTDAKGKATAADVPFGRYRLVETAAPPGYALDESDQTIVVEGGKTSYANSWEPPLTGSIGVQKTSSAPAVTNENPCYALSGAVYGVYDDPACTNQVQTIVTDANGFGQSEATLWPGSYWIKEVSAPKGYALDAQSYPVALSVKSCLDGKAPLARVVDEPQLALVEPVALKIDAESGTSQAQGDATLAGAVFQVEHFAGVFATPEEAAASGFSPTLTLTAVADEQGVARIDPALLPSNGAGSGLPLGTLVVREVSAPQGYLLSESPAFACPITASGDKPLDALFHAAEVPDRVIRGDIAILKVGAGEGTTGDKAEKRPLKGVAFDIVHKASGQVAARIVTDDQGRAATAHAKDPEQAGALPFGTYLVQEDPATTPAGYQAAPAFPVTVADHGRTYSYTVENDTGTFLKVMKRDADTGRTVAGRTVFRILDRFGNAVPFNADSDGNAKAETEFATDESGSCLLPGKLNGGETYWVQEIAPPYGYVLDANPVPFSLAAGNGHNPKDPLIVTIENKPQTACLTLHKTDAATGLPLARPDISWEVRAAQDVVSADGTTHVSQGETVATLTSDDSGSACATGLHLGTYEIIETQAPQGYVRATEPLRVELAYGDPSQPCVHAEVQFPNQSAQGCITIAKTDAVSKEPLAEALYEIRAAHDIVAADGSVLLRAEDVAATLLTDDSGAATTAPLPLGRYEAVEIRAPKGYQIDEAKHPVELAYQDQETPLVEARLDLADNPLPDDQPEPAIAETGDGAQSAALSITGIIAAAAFLAVASFKKAARPSVRAGTRCA